MRRQIAEQYDITSVERVEELIAQDR